MGDFVLILFSCRLSHKKKSLILCAFKWKVIGRIRIFGFSILYIREYKGREHVSSDVLVGPADCDSFPNSVIIYEII